MKDFFKMVCASCLGFVLANVVVILISMLMFGAMVGALSEMLGGKETSHVTLSSGSVFVLDPEGEIPDSSADDFFDSFMKGFNGSDVERSYTLPQIVRAIDEARSNPDVEAIVLRPDRCYMSYDTAQEIRKALLRFRESGKPIYALSLIHI